jgi:hypothetical protein
MRHWTLADFQLAAGHLLRTCEFMPTPADFENLRKAAQPTGGEAWEMVLRNQAAPGSRAMRAAEIVGGRYYITHCDIERDLPHVQRRFLEIYDELTDVDEVREALPQIAPPPSAPRICSGGPQRVGRVLESLKTLHGPQSAVPEDAAG